MKIYVRSKFSCVCSSHDLCARTRAQLRGNIGHIASSHSILFAYLYTAPLAVKTNHSSDPRKKKGLEKTRSRGKRTRKNLSTGFYRETIPQERTSWSKSTLLRCGRPWPRDKKI